MNFTWTKPAVVIAAAIGILLPAATRLYAAAPANDDFTNATGIAAMPSRNSVETYDATVAPDDPPCAAMTGGTVWYRFTPASNVTIEINTTESNYDTTLCVFTGSRGNLNLVASNDDEATGIATSRVRFLAQAGVTYHILAGSYGREGGVNLVLAVTKVPE